MSPKRIRLIGELHRTETRLSAYQLKGKWRPAYRAAAIFLYNDLTTIYQHDFEGIWKYLSEVRRLELAIMEPNEGGREGADVEHRDRALSLGSDFGCIEECKYFSFDRNKLRVLRCAGFRTPS